MNFSFGEINNNYYTLTIDKRNILIPIVIMRLYLFNELIWYCNSTDSHESQTNDKNVINKRESKYNKKQIIVS